MRVNYASELRWQALHNIYPFIVGDILINPARREKRSYGLTKQYQGEYPLKKGPTFLGMFQRFRSKLMLILSYRTTRSYLSEQ